MFPSASVRRQDKPFHLEVNSIVGLLYMVRLCLNLFLYNGDLQSNKLSGLSAITPFVNVYVAPPTPGHPAKHHDTAESTASYLALVCVPTCVILCESLMKTQLPWQISLATTAYDGMWEWLYIRSNSDDPAAIGTTPGLESHDFLWEKPCLRAKRIWLKSLPLHLTWYDTSR